MATPAKGTRLSAGVYADGKGGTYHSSTGTAPTTTKVAKTNSTKGAFAVDPKASPPQQLAQLDAKIKAGKASSAEQHQRNTLYNTVRQQAKLAPQTPGQQFDKTISQGNQAQQDQFNQIENQGNFDPQTMGIHKFQSDAPDIGQFQSNAPPIQQFQPGDFQNQFNGAYGHAMDQFNRSSQPAFDKQNADFQQMAAEKGWDPSSKVYQDSIKQIQDSQNTARLNAQDTAYQTGLGAQNQAYTQSSNTYGQNLGAQNQDFSQDLSAYGQNLAGQGQQFGQDSTSYGNDLTGQGQQFGQANTQYQMPFQNLSSLSPYLQAQYGNQQAQQQQGYSQQNAATAQGYAKELADLQQKYSMQTAQFAVDHRAGPSGRGGGGGGRKAGSPGLTFAEQQQLQQNAMYNNWVLNYGAQPNSTVPSTGNSFVSGAANGIAAGVTYGLTK